MSDWRLKSIALGSSVTFGAKTLGFLSQILTTAFVAKHLSFEAFGLWSIFLSLVILSPCFDLGLGGPTLRNQLALLHDNQEEARHYYLSTTTLLFVLYGLFALLLLFIIPCVNWTIFFHIENEDLAHRLPNLISFVAVMLCLRIPFAMNADAFYGYHESHLRGLLDGLEFALLSGVAICVVVWHGSFCTLIYCYYATYVFVAFLSFCLFLKRRKWKFQWIQWKFLAPTLKPKLKLSFQFWMQNLWALLLLSQISTYIAHLQSAKEAGHLNLIFRLFTPFIGIHFTVLNPLWTHYTQAYNEGNFSWISKMMKWMFGLTVGLFSLMTIALALTHSQLIYWWTGKWIVNTGTAYLIGIWTLLYALINCTTVYLSSISHVFPQIISYSIATVMCFTLSYLASFQWGSTGIIAAHIISLIFCLVSLGWVVKKQLSIKMQSIGR